MTTSTPPPAKAFLLKRPNRWPAGRRFRQRHLHAFRIDQRIGSILLAVAASLLINGLVFWQLYTAKPPPLPRPEPERVIVTLGEPDPDPEALTDLAPLVPAEIGEESAVAGAVPETPTPAPSAPAAPAPPAVADVQPPTPTPPPVAPPSIPQSPSVVEPAPAPSEVAETLVEVTLPPAEPVAASAQDVTDLPAEIGEVLAADVASPEPVPLPAPGNALTDAEPVEPVDAAVSEAAETSEPVGAARPSLPPDAAEQLARLLESPTVEIELPTLPPRAAAEPLRALPPQLRRDPERAPLPELAAPEPAPAPALANVPPSTLPPETTSTPIERAEPTRPELVVESISPEAPTARPVTPPRSRTLARAERSEPERPTATVTAAVAPVAPVVAVPESRRQTPVASTPERPRLDLPLTVRPPAAPPPVVLPPTRTAPEPVRSATVAIELPRERPALAAPAPAPRAALPPAVESGPEAASASRPAPSLDRDALRVEPQAPTRLDPALVAGSAADSRSSTPATEAAPASGNDADFGLPSARPGAADGLDWSDSIRAASRDQVAEESAARRAARAPWQRDEAWFADDPPARMEQLLRDDPNLARMMVDFLVGALIGGSAQTPGKLYEVGPDPGVLIKLWLDRHHGDLQLACRHEAAAMPESARRVLCPGERTEALEFDAARPAGN